ncbi:restriction endonuclease subunit S [Lactiplantibacillus argentoratensis]|uniref:restriction endonuclease subunit S n=1 Tax=Lactiplantibacillus argentoratensis TaxID=271881 RepID=UPI001BDC0027|nr:restriction endonuclease subunit S [Lactiplantibacillus argentoratensis]MBT1142910.1 restriction endonuclease subunit S [Lactiplantibacillus argentoratensis]MBT1145770.1 restriction endonuclease subunit S [Lactiplantibacillus argentoratensis]MBT1148525.1 restriction endonuclease subunit S [Lactiplantibacillus argentoratensis]MBT1153144.1 restriction endonuclease subunit S [Lactiplantibacillus argentoratensis]MDK9679856.1 restriction endonuclease subunit S [Lactiplantibacillus argentoratensi
MKNENLVPKVRFKGFSDPWEQRKLGEMYYFKNGLNKGKEFFGFGTPIVNFVDVFHNRGLYAQNLNGRVNLTEKEINNFRVHKGDIFFTRTSETIEEIGFPSVMLSEPQDTVFSGFVLRGRSLEKPGQLVNIFKKYVFFTNAFRKEMVTKSSMTTRALTSGTALSAMRVKFPLEATEQKKIGELITRLDYLIAANEDKLEQLKTLKKLMMQKIFSQKWRFKGFTDPWEQRKLKWFLRVSKLKNIDGIFDKNSVLSVSGEFGVVNQIAFQGRSFAGKSILNYGILDHNDVVYTKSPLKSNPYGIIKTNLGKAGVVSTLYAVYAPLKTVYSPILGYYFNLDTRVNNYLRPLVNKGAKNDMKVRDEAVLEGKVCIPDSIETQKRICNLFSLIDNLIAANEDKLNQLKKLKKYLMQNMFV